MQHTHRAAIALSIMLFALVLAGCSGGVAKPEGWASPVFDDGITYAFQRKDSLTAIDQDGNVKWTFPDKNKEPQKDIKLGSVYGTPVLDDGILYFATYDGDALAVNADTGDLIWRNEIKESSVGTVAVANGLFAVGTTEGRLFVLNADTGAAAPNWPAKGVPMGGPIWAPTIANDGTLYVATMRGVVPAFDFVSGTTSWAEDFKADGAIADLALLDSGELVVPSLDRHVYFRNSSDGTEAMPPAKLDDWAWGVPAVTDDALVLTDISGKVYRFDRSNTSTPTWVYSTEHRLKSSPTIVNGIVIVADRSPEVHFITLDTGQQRGNTVPVSDVGTIRANPTVEAGMAYFITTKGHLMKADPGPGTVTEWQIGRYRP